MGTYIIFISIFLCCFIVSLVQEPAAPCPGDTIILTCTTSHFLDWVNSSNGETQAQFWITSIPETEFKPLPSLCFIAFNLTDVSGYVV